MPGAELKTDLPQAFTFSQTSIKDYLDCPRLFQLRYIEQLPWPAAQSKPLIKLEEMQEMANHFHRMAQQRLLGIPSSQIPLPANMPDLETWWRNFLVLPLLDDPAPKFVEFTLSAPAGEYRLLAKYDLVLLQPSGSVVIYDWKTYRRRPNDQDMEDRIQTRLYRALLARAGARLNGGQPIPPENIRMTYWYAGFPDQPALFDYDSSQYAQDWKVFTELIQEIASCRDFPPGDAETCPFCTYRSYCDRGDHTGSLDELESSTGGSSLVIDLDSLEALEF